MRNHNKLRAFQLADKLALEIYKCTSVFPSVERFGLTNQLRRAAVSVPSNIVEGCAKSTQADYLRFLDIAYGSVCEAHYQLNLALRLGFIDKQPYEAVESLASETSKVLNGLIRSIKNDSSG